MKNYGIDWKRELAEQSEEDYVRGVIDRPAIVQIPELERETFLPEGELQYGKEDFMDCASRAPINKLEADFNYLYHNNLLKPENKKWLEDRGYVAFGKITFSDRFIAIKSGTTREGNSLKAPLQAIHDYGLIPKSLLPRSGNMTWDEYHDPSKITKYMKNLGDDFAARFPVNYEKVYEEHFIETLKEDMLDTAGYAWPELTNGEYGRVDYPPNHAFLTIRAAFCAFDNYEEEPGDYIKQLAKDYDFLGYGYRVFISGQYVPKPRIWFLNFLWP